ncbi:MAG: ShlB/FhaC/HecB family hemolysin secretion/activation protein [Gammaproteobacteria bacterium]|nr:ShlB/FhaC/HecB family hemolysin secretion/activation protein [Gammaproteobacteria bacterium]MBI5617663.1 ShlB/FhaC/HecB family hemolysin secretion/activation protein [Gammaproteobacteria bacterium]
MQEPLRPRQELPKTPADLLPKAPAAPQAGAGVPAGGKQVLVERFEITGNSAISGDELHQVVAPYEGKQLTLLEIYDVADLVTRYYRTHGFTVASANVPAQKVASGTIKLEVIEGRIGKINVEGERRYNENFLRWNMTSLKSGEVVRDSALERQLLVLNDLPGYSARSVIQPGDEYGTSDITVQSAEKLVDAALRLNNYGRSSIGEWRTEADLALNGLTGRGDKLEMSGVMAERGLLHYGRFRYSLPITNQGTRVSAYFARYDYNVDRNRLPAAFSSLDLDGEGDNFGINVLHPFIRSKNLNLYMGLGFDRTVTRQFERGTGTRSGEDIGVGVLTALVTYIHPDSSFSTANFSFSSNFDANTPASGKAENNAEAAKFQIDLSHFRKVYHELSVALRATGVASAKPLVDTERFRLGGPTSVRAFPSSELSGDDGYFLSAELQHPLPEWKMFDTTAKVFIDHGRVFTKEYEKLGVHHTQSLTGIGFGILAHATRYFDVDVSVSHPLGAYDSTDGEGGARVWAGFSANY